jgi:hypothetical protein
MCAAFDFGRLRGRGIRRIESLAAFIGGAQEVDQFGVGRWVKLRRARELALEGRPELTQPDRDIGRHGACSLLRVSVQKTRVFSWRSIGAVNFVLILWACSQRFPS